MKQIKKAFIYVVLLAISAMLLSCGNASKKNEISVFAAASLTESLTKIANNYMKDNKDVNIKLNFGSSGALKKQIEEGITCDLFLSASTKQMEGLKEKELLLNNDYEKVLKNNVVLVVPDANKKDVDSFDDLINYINDESIMFGICDIDTPIGEYAINILKKYGIDEDKIYNSSNITLASNVKEVVSLVKEGVVDAGIVYSTDANVSNLKIVDVADASLSGDVYYGMAVIANTENLDCVNEFVEYIKSSDSKDIFMEAGFDF